MALASNIPPREGPVELVRSRLLEALETQTLRPGDLLPSERVLAEQFGVSRVSVREAIISLQAVGLLTVQHGRGCYVSESITELVTKPFAVWLRVHRDEIIEILRVRGALDGLAAAEAARLVAREGAPTLSEAAAAFATAARESPSDTTQLMRLDNAFHQAVARASGLATVSGLLDNLNHSVANPHRLIMSVHGRPARAADQHEEIVAAVVAGDVSGARDAAIRHVESLVGLILSYDSSS